jgi:hypothetical protein
MNKHLKEVIMEYKQDQGVILKKIDPCLRRLCRGYLPGFSAEVQQDCRANER